MELAIFWEITGLIVEALLVLLFICKAMGRAKLKTKHTGHFTF